MKQLKDEMNILKDNDIMDEEIEKFEILFDCYNEPDDKLTKSGMELRDELYATVRRLYKKIDKPDMKDWDHPKTRTKILEKAEKNI